MAQFDPLSAFEASHNGQRELTDGAVPCGMAPHGCTGHVLPEWTIEVKDEAGEVHRIGLCPRIQEHALITTAQKPTKAEESRAVSAKKALRRWLNVNAEVKRQRVLKGL